MGGKDGDMIPMPPPPQHTHMPGVGEVVSPASPGSDVGIKKDPKQGQLMHGDSTLAAAAVQHMLVQAPGGGLIDGNKGKNKYQPKKCEHGR